MSDTLESLQRKIVGAAELNSVVRTMKAIAASNINQYEMAVSSLSDYYRTIALGAIAYFNQRENKNSVAEKKKKDKNIICAIVFGSDMGLVGQFNDGLSEFVKKSLQAMPGEKEVWAVGERIYARLGDAGLSTSKLFSVPVSVNSITSVVRQILIKSEERFEKGELNEFYIFHNRPKPDSGYESVIQRWLPLDEKWKQDLTALHWPSKYLPEVIGGMKNTLLTLVHEYLFVSLFRACAESLASEHASRLEAMQRAEKNIDDLLEDLSNKFHRLRQSSIDEELFDVISGFEALKEKK